MITTSTLQAVGTAAQGIGLGAILSNPKVYGIILGVQAANWAVTWFAKNIPVPSDTAPVIQKFGYAIVQKAADITAKLPHA